MPSKQTKNASFAWGKFFLDKCSIISLAIIESVSTLKEHNIIIKS